MTFALYAICLLYTSDTGCAAVQRGPVVYCAEGLDNGGDVLSLSLAAEGAVTQLPYEPELLGGFVIHLQGTTYDKSVRGMLRGLRRSLKERE